MKKINMLLTLCIFNVNAAIQNPYPEIDTHNMFTTLYTFPEQLQHAVEIGKQITLKNIHLPQIKNIIFAGMGGSAIAGDIATLLCKDNATIPMIVNRDYTLPNWVNHETLVILLSYSGNTEETISCLHEATNRNAHIIGVTSGGIIKKELLARNSTVITIPDGMMPRSALGYLTIPLLYIMEQLDQIDPLFELHLTNVIKELSHYRLNLSSLKENENIAYSIAQQIITAMPLIYTPENTRAIASRWRTQLAENSKTLSSIHTLPELNHNEIVTWQNNDTKKDSYGIIWLTESDMHKRNKKRLEITRQLMQKKCAYQKTIHCTDQSLIERVFFLLYIGDWVSYWTAILKNIDPTPIDNINTLKKFMSS